MAKNLAMNILLDVYGVMLTERQLEIMELYYNHDLSLGEIAEEVEITRQGVMNCLRKSEKHLEMLERKLGLILKLRDLEGEIEELEQLIMTAEVKNESLMCDIDEKIVDIKRKL
ncbi:MAG: DNA-binding protein [Oscillospiraceae bacterium]|nr:DNA-binding protein [Oscillospiraceae bacterium]